MKGLCTIVKICDAFLRHESANPVVTWSNCDYRDRDVTLVYSHMLPNSAVITRTAIQSQRVA